MKKPATTVRPMRPMVDDRVLLQCLILAEKLKKLYGPHYTIYLSELRHSLYVPPADWDEEKEGEWFPDLTLIDAIMRRIEPELRQELEDRGFEVFS
jgi:hypothetical protein